LFLHYKYTVISVILIVSIGYVDYERVQAFSSSSTYLFGVPVTSFSLSSFHKSDFHSYHIRPESFLCCSSSVSASSSLPSSNHTEDLTRQTLSPADTTPSIYTTSQSKREHWNLNWDLKTDYGIPSSLSLPQWLNMSAYANKLYIQDIMNQTQFFSFLDNMQNDPSQDPQQQQQQRLQKSDLIRLILRKAASLSLKDYEWRSSFFRTTEAERRVQESLARLMGDEYATYIRPGDAPETKIGPLVCC